MAPSGLADLTMNLPTALAPLARLAVNLRWTWNHATDALWENLAPEIWRQTGNPVLAIQNATRSRLEQLAADAAFVSSIDALDQALSDYLTRPSWFQQAQLVERPLRIAYFSMEYGLTEALPLYSGGLGVLAGDHLKTASDLGVPLVAVGLFYRSGYFRQMLDTGGKQLELYTINSFDSLPVRPVLDHEGRPLRVMIELPGRDLRLRVWHVGVGRVDLYLLDSDDPLNSPFDRGITSHLYGGDSEARLMQEIVLGLGGWRALLALGLEPDVCHLNEGHAALATIERARSFAATRGIDFFDALWATRAGNVFTTHTPVAAAFDTFPLPLLAKYGNAYAALCRIRPEQLLGLGRMNPEDATEPFNMAYLAARTCARINGVSELHGRVSRAIFAPLHPRWPENEIPVTHVTNAVHVPSWDSPWADRIWTTACGKERWLGEPAQLSRAVAQLTDEQIWDFRAFERKDLVDYARRRLAQQLGQRAESAAVIGAASEVLDPNVLTLGFARRFTEYKRPTMLLHDIPRLTRLLTNPDRPVQLLIAGKAHPRDELGRSFVRQWSEFVQRPEIRKHAVFLEDYDMALAEQLVQGVDVWINTPRRPWEASGTSGMKILVNGGLNLSELDGWWAEAWSPEVGWRLGDGNEHFEPGWDLVETEQLFRTLEEQVVPEFYERDAEGIPRAWVARIRASLSQLTPRFSSNRMLEEYLQELYVPAARAYWRRIENDQRIARELRRWYRELRQHWPEIHWGNISVEQDDSGVTARLQIYLGGLQPDSVRVELYADPAAGSVVGERHELARDHALSGASGGFVYSGRVRTTRPASDYTPRVVAAHPEVAVPAEVNLIRWPNP